jgi:hypothetical protein
MSRRSVDFRKRFRKEKVEDTMREIVQRHASAKKPIASEKANRLAVRVHQKGHGHG